MPIVIIIKKSQQKWASTDLTRTGFPISKGRISTAWSAAVLPVSPKSAMGVAACIVPIVLVIGSKRTRKLFLYSELAQTDVLPILLPFLVKYWLKCTMTLILNVHSMINVKGQLSSLIYQDMKSCVRNPSAGTLIIVKGTRCQRSARK